MQAETYPRDHASSRQEIDAKQRVKHEGRTEGEDENADSQPSTMQSLGNIDEHISSTQTSQQPRSLENFNNKSNIPSENGNAMQKGEEFKDKNAHHVEVKEEGHALSKQDKEEILELAQQLTEKIQELKASGQTDSEQKMHVEQSGTQEQHEHHHLSIESPSFQPNKESSKLLETVNKELEISAGGANKGSEFQPNEESSLIDRVNKGLEESSAILDKKIEEIDHKTQSQPVMENLKQSTQKFTEKISQKFDEVKGKVVSKNENFKGRDESPEDQYQKDSQSAARNLKQDVQQISNKISERVEDRNPNASQEFKDRPTQNKENTETKQQDQSQTEEQFTSKDVEQDEQQVSGQTPEKFEDKNENENQDIQYQKGGQSNLEKLKQGAQQLSDKISEKVGDIKEGAVQRNQEFEADTMQNKEKSENPEPKQQDQSQNQDQPSRDNLKQGTGEISNKTFKKVEDLKESSTQSNEKALNQEKFQNPEESKNEVDQPEKATQLAVSNFKETVQDINEQISEKVEDAKNNINAERQPLIDKVMGRIHAVTDNINQTVENVKNALKIEEKTEINNDRQPIIDIVKDRITQNFENVKHMIRPSHETKIDDQNQQIAEREQTAEGEQGPGEDKGQKNESLRQKISAEIHNLSDKISQNVENMKNGSNKHENQEDISEQGNKNQTQEQPSELIQEEGQTLKQKVSGGVENLSGKISQNLENLKDKFRSGKEEAPQGEGDNEFHTVITGFSESVNEFKHEKRIQELGTDQLLSDNPFEPLADDKVKISQPLSNADIVGGDIKQITEGFSSGNVELRELTNEQELMENKSLLQKARENLGQKIENIKDKFRSKDTANEQEVEEQEDNEPQEQKESLRQKITGGINSLSDRISQNVENVKGRFTKGKEEEEESTETQDITQEKGEQKPSELSVEEKYSFKEKISGSIHNVSNQISQSVDNMKNKFRSGKEGEIDQNPKFDQGITSNKKEIEAENSGTA